MGCRFDVFDAGRFSLIGLSFGFFLASFAL